jgi:hypothetical protein
MGPFFSILAGLQVIFSLAAFVLIMWQRKRKLPSSSEEVPGQDNSLRPSAEVTEVEAAC